MYLCILSFFKKTEKHTKKKSIAKIWEIVHIFPLQLQHNITFKFNKKDCSSCYHCLKVNSEGLAADLDVVRSRHEGQVEGLGEFNGSIKLTN